MSKIDQHLRKCNQINSLSGIHVGTPTRPKGVKETERGDPNA